MIARNEYLQKLVEWKDEKVIKVVTGLRRCGKSTLLKQFQEYLLKNGIDEKQIVCVNFEMLEYEELLDYRKLYAYIRDRLVEGKQTYVFLDEVQQVENFQKAVDSLYVTDGVDMYITGSNAFLLSGELATLLSGRYVEINMLPFSFAEYCRVKSGDRETLLADYMRYGSLPYVASMQGHDRAEMYIEGIYNTIIIKDIEERQRRRESDPAKRKVTDIALLKNMAKFLASATGSIVSVKSIADYITSGGRRISQNTVDDYLDALIEPYIFYRAERYDVNGRQLLKSGVKLYISDLGIRNYILPKRNYDIGYSLENVVYLELLRRGFRVCVGKVGDAEVDFVAEKNGEVSYYQVTASMTEERTFEREMASLRRITDNYPKTIITLDKYTEGSYGGIEVVNAVDWLLNT